MKALSSSADFSGFTWRNPAKARTRKSGVRAGVQFDVERAGWVTQAMWEAKSKGNTKETQNLVAAATAATATASATARERRPFAGATIAVRRGKHRKLNLVLLPGALRAGDLLLPIDHNFLKFVLAVFADIFVDRHCSPSFDNQANYTKLSYQNGLRTQSLTLDVRCI